MARALSECAGRIVQAALAEASLQSRPALDLARSRARTTPHRFFHLTGKHWETRIAIVRCALRRPVRWGANTTSAAHK